MAESSLPGGFVNVSVRVGDTVRRRPAARAEFVHQLLVLLERVRWDGAPRFLGMDEQGREVLGFVEGHVAWEPVQPSGVGSDESLARVAELVREFHDLTAETALAGGEEVIYHNDLSLKNTVYRDAGAGLRPVAFIDWDLAAPGRRGLLPYGQFFCRPRRSKSRTPPGMGIPRSSSKVSFAHVAPPGAVIAE